MFYAYESSPTSMQKPSKIYQSVSTKLTTANWSFDHTSRAPSPLIEEPQNPVIHQLTKHIEKLNIYLKYFKDLSFQLKTSLDSEINKLNIKKSEILASVELDFQSRVNDLKMKYNEKSAKLIKNLREISNEINKSIQITDLAVVGNDIEEETVEEILKFSVNKEGFDEEWLRIKSSESDKGLRSERYRKESEEVRNDLVSTLYTETTGKVEGEDRSKIRVYVPFGNPIYSFFYLVKPGKGYKVLDLVTSLQTILGKDRRLWVCSKSSESDTERHLKPYEKLPDKISDSWPRLYIKFD
jgi:hypothetical protein